MATGAFPRRAAIGYYASTVDLLAFGMAEPAGDILVGSRQRKRARGFVIEQCGGPANRIMASGAIHRLGPLLELPCVDVLVAAHAAFRRALERNLARARISRRGPVAIQAPQHAV